MKQIKDQKKMEKHVKYHETTELQEKNKNSFYCPKGAIVFPSDSSSKGQTFKRKTDY